MMTYRADISRIANWIKDDLSKSLEDIFLNKAKPELYKNQTYKVINEDVQLEERKSKQLNDAILFSFSCK